MLTQLSISTNRNMGQTTMQSFYILFFISVLFDQTIPINGVGILDPIRNIFDPLSNRPHKKLNRRLTQVQIPFADRGPLKNSNVQFQSSSQLPSTAELVAYQQNYSKPPFDIPRTLEDLEDPEPDPTASKIMIDNPKTLEDILYHMWWPGDVERTEASNPSQSVTQSQLVMSTTQPSSSSEPDIFETSEMTDENVNSGSSQGWGFDTETTSPDSSGTGNDYDKIIAERFPQAIALLQELRKINKVKEQNQVTSSTTTLKNYAINEIEELLKPELLLPPNPAKSAFTKTMKITKKKFYHQAQPVTPEDEKKKSRETYYYIDD